MDTGAADPGAVVVSPRRLLARATSGAAAAVLVVRFLAAAAALGFGVAAARIFGAAALGILALGMTVALVSRTLGQLGLATPMLRMVAAAHSDGDMAAVAAVYRRGLRLGTAASTVAAGLLYLLAPVLAGPVFSEPALTGVLRVLSVSVVPSVLLVVHASLLRAVHRPVAAALLDSLGPPALATAVVVAVGGRLGVAGAAWALVAGWMVMLAGAVLVWARVSGIDRTTVSDPAAARSLLSSGLPVLVLTATFLAVEWTDTIMLGVLGSAEQVGVYTAASRSAVMVAFVLHAMNAVTAPHFAALHRRGDRVGMRRLSADSTLVMIVAALPLLVLAIALGEPILAVFGAEFRGGAGVLALLAAAQFVHVAFGPVGIVLTMTGRERALRDVVVGAAVVNVALNALLIPPFGPEGAAVATGLSLVGLNVVAARVVRRQLGFYTMPGARRWSDV